jgi:hypothetical protein
MMDIGTHVKVQMVAHIGRRAKTYGYRYGKIVAYYEYGNYYLVNFGKYRGCYRPDELIEVKK